MCKSVFTICSNNYLAQAKTLADSFLEFNKGYKFYIFLCDTMRSDIDYSKFDKINIVNLQSLNIEKFKDMSAKYNIVELNTSIKPFCFDYLYKNYNNDIVIYLDPDICVFNRFTYIEEKLSIYDVILTPHCCTPIEFDGESPTENTFTQFGIYNLGFCATKRSMNAMKMINWWKNRLEVNCFDSPESGIFVDQLPMNLAPIFFDNIFVSKNLGLNAAPWNLHERDILYNENSWYVNNELPLIFFHFSNFNINFSDLISTYYSRANIDRHDDIKALYSFYRNKLLKNGYEYYSGIRFAYSSHIRHKDSPFIKIIKYIKRHPLFLFRKDFWVCK